jgi:hypothetical protein
MMGVVASSSKRGRRHDDIDSSEEAGLGGGRRILIAAWFVLGERKEGEKGLISVCVVSVDRIDWVLRVVVVSGSDQTLARLLSKTSFVDLSRVV